MEKIDKEMIKYNVLSNTVPYVINRKNKLKPMFKVYFFDVRTFDNFRLLLEENDIYYSYKIIQDKTILIIKIETVNDCKNFYKLFKNEINYLMKYNNSFIEIVNVINKKYEKIE